MREADSIYTVGRLQLSSGDQFGLRVARNDGAIDGAFNPIAFDREGDLLRDCLPHPCRLVHRSVFSTSTIHLKRLGTESAHDEGSVAVSGAVKVALLGRSHIVAGNDYAV